MSEQRPIDEPLTAAEGIVNATLIGVVIYAGALCVGLLLTSGA